VDRLADWCEQYDGPFFTFEKQLRQGVWALGRLFVALFLLARHRRLHDRPQRSPGCWRFPDLVPRTLRTFFGEVRYQRAYWVRRWGGGGFHPLDEELGLTRDGFSPWVISLACRLSTYLSYAKTTLVLEAFWGWSPSTETVEQWVLGLARHAAPYMASAPPFLGPEGEVLVIEVDGKAVPTATEEELRKRRGHQQHNHRCPCGCQRHRGRSKREARGAKKRRKKGDKSKNGRSATLVAMYTLQWNELRELLYQSGRKLVVRLRQMQQGIACRGPGTKRKRVALDSLLRYLEPRRRMMCYGKWLQQDLVIATGVIEGAVRYVIGERMDCAGMRWLEGKAEAILHLRCIEVNGLWDHFFDWCSDQWAERLRCHETVQIRTDQPLEMVEAA
jgi:hypothetical protein